MTPRVLRTALAATALLALPACTGDDGTSAEAGPAQRLLATLDAGEEVAPDQFGELLDAGFDALTTARIRSVTETGASRTTVEGVADYADEVPTSSVTATGLLPDVEVRVRAVDGVLHVDLGPLTDGRFLTVDPHDPEGPLGDLAALVDATDPRGQLDAYVARLDEVVHVGRDDGLAHFRVAVRAASDARPPTLELWLDDAGRVRRSETTSTRRGVTTTTVTEMYDLGVDVDVEAPPAGERIDELPPAR